ncbi:MAG: 16S rRNA (guanine(527)-N(7))-methyltransferase RsmG [Anaerolineae bacterium]|nr:16S rRNA (guanine(527)-N(7))-methyltransferase RsmG [Thermoflexales bacterium]MDW8407164.1 16S rRNA (guanine(527)-N(7))-methyltransferase RsmG [Anaerolineae bacterium]
MPPQPAEIADIADELRIRLSDTQCSLLAQYSRLLIDWNNRFNLTGIKDDAGILIRHLADSLTVVPFLDRCLGENPALNLIDIGSGAGLPGIPIKIARPHIDITLVDSTGKKVMFCQIVIKELGLTQARAVHGRAEEMGRQSEYRERYDVVIARAVAPLPTLVEYLLPFVQVNGWCIAMKGSEAQTEAERARHAIETLGGAAPIIEPVTLPRTTDRRALVIIHKIRRTPARFPRQAGAPRTAPL